MALKRSSIGAIFLVVIGLLAIGGYMGIMHLIHRKDDVAASDSKDARKVRIGGDSYLGYFFMNSPLMKQSAAKRGIAIDFTNDGGDYDQRLEKFNKGEYDAIVLPINSYLTHGEKYKYPGVIVASIAESKGADAVACFGNKLPTGKVGDLNDASLKIVYTGESPSSFLLDLAVDNFDLFNLKTSSAWKVEVNGSDKALKAAKQHQGDCFVMWEPDFSRALRDVPELKKVWGSDQFSGYIIDVFVFRRDFVLNHADDLKAFFETYFLTMRTYANDRQKLIDDIHSATSLKSSEVEVMLKEIHWYDLLENASRQFGIGSPGATSTADGVFNTIVATTDVLVRQGKLAKDPLEGDPNRIINREILTQVQSDLPKQLTKEAVKRNFSQLSDDEWQKLHEVGVMRVAPITFQSGTAELSSDGEKQVDKIAEMLTNNYGDYRVVVKGHTGKGEDEPANVELSRQRADAVIQRLTVQGIDVNRLKEAGLGSAQPPAKHPGENQREYMQRVPRVEFDLFQDNNNL